MVGGSSRGGFAGRGRTGSDRIRDNRRRSDRTRGDRVGDGPRGGDRGVSVGTLAARDAPFADSGLVR